MRSHIGYLYNARRHITQKPIFRIEGHRRYPCIAPYRFHTSGL
jgi:hypothetical protein